MWSVYNSGLQKKIIFKNNAEKLLGFVRLQYA